VLDGSQPDSEIPYNYVLETPKFSYKAHPDTFVLQYTPEQEGIYKVSLIVDGDMSKPYSVPRHAPPGHGATDPIHTNIIAPAATVNEPASFVNTKFPFGTDKHTGGRILLTSRSPK